MLSPVRCVVTGHDDSSKSCIQFDGAAPWVFTELGLPGLQNTEIWKTQQTPAVLTPNMGDSLDANFQLAPPAGGSAFRVMDLAPESQQGDIDPADLYAKLGNADFAAKAEDLAHPLMHRTDTIDYAIVLEGEITLITDTGETTLNRGDVVVQLGCNHMWVNRGEVTCRVAFVMLPAQVVI